MTNTFLRNDATFAAIGSGDVSGGLQAANNLSDVASASTSRTNLGVAYGEQSIFVPGAAIRPAVGSAAAGPNTTETGTNLVDMTGLDFIAASTTIGQFSITMPKSWDLGAISWFYRFYQLANATGNVVFQLQGIALSDGASADQPWGGAVNLVTAGGAGGNIYKSAEQSVTFVGTPAADCLVAFRVYRNIGAFDTLASTVRLLGLRIKYNTNANNDT
jgi:hypothetical protein